jgi:hypothetical protein
MTRRRARAVLRTELPIKASRAVDFKEQVEGAFALLSEAAPDALARLAIIARTYHDGRRMEAQKVARPDCRKSLEAVRNLAVGLSEVVNLLPVEHSRTLGAMAKRELPVDRNLTFLPREIGHALDEVAQVDLRRWLPDTPAALEPILARFGLLAAELADRCSNLPQDAEWPLIELQEYVSLMPVDVAEAEYLHRLVDTLGKLAGVAAELMKSERGPRSDTVQMRAVQALKVEFERAGEKATHNSKGEEGYTGEATTPFGKFVHQFFADMDPEDKHRRGLDDAIAFASWESRCRGRRAKGEGAKELHQRRIIELLTEGGVTNFSASA